MAGVSPDGKYRFDNSGDGDLAVIEMDSGNRRILVQEPGISTAEWVWAPDGKSIAFSKFTDATGNPVDGIWVVNLDGVVRLLNASLPLRSSWQPARE